MEPKELEAAQLARKILNLKSYMSSNEYNKLSLREQNLCHQQLGAMQTYYKCLSKRIELLENLDFKSYGF
jgi:hypothetical protein